MAEAQEAADKLEAGLDKTEGIGSRQAARQAGRRQAETRPASIREAGEKIKKWTKEIIALDADNKAGLKKKYQFKAVLADAAELMQAGKTDEANAALDKALETAGVSGDDIQAAQFLKAQISLMQHNNEEGVKYLKKALEAAPAGQYAPVIKMLLASYDQSKKPAAKKPAVE